MVRCRRRDPPQQLNRYRVLWETRYAGLAAGDWATRRAKEILREGLLPMTHGKCAYCESLLDVSSYTGVEHYLPRKHYTHLVFEWSNLLPTCMVCNGQKGDTDHQRRLLKPDDEDPEPFFWIHAGSGELEPHPLLDEDGRQRALETIQLCDLQRSELCSLRAKALRRVGKWIAAPGLDAAEWLEPSEQYKLAVRQALTLGGRDDLLDEDRRRFDA